MYVSLFFFLGQGDALFSLYVTRVGVGGSRGLVLGGELAAKVRDFGSNLLKWAPAQMVTRSQMGTKPATVGHLALGAI